jgi:hypothetical protein
LNDLSIERNKCQIDLGKTNETTQQ